MHLDGERRRHRGAPCRVGTWSGHSTCRDGSAALVHEAAEANAQDGCTCLPTFLVLRRWGRPAAVEVQHDQRCSIFAPA